jgi:hypothetical protein
MAGRGALDTISLEAMVYLLEFLPQTNPHSDWIPGHLLDSNMMQQLAAESFSGFAVFSLEQEWLGGILFYKGQALEAWRRALGGLENRAEAYRNLLPMLEFASVRFFVLPNELIPCITGFTLSETIETYEATKVHVGQLLEKLSAAQFSGSVILENGVVAQAWFFSKGVPLLNLEFPDSFREGNLHILHNPQSKPEDVVHFAALEAENEISARVLMLRATLEAQLIDHLGINAKPLLEANATWLAQSNPVRLQETIEIWLEETYGTEFVTQFRLRLEE